MTVWRIIAEIVDATKGGLVKLSPGRIRRMAERRRVWVGERDVYTALNVVLKDCKAFPDGFAKRPDGGNRELYYVYNRMCVKRVLEVVAA